MNYRLILFGKHVYREFLLKEDQEKPVMVGTGIECAVRLNRTAFFDDFRILLTQKENQWHLSCEQNVYLMTGNALKQYARRLEHGDSLSLYFENSETKFLQVEFLIDFEEENREFTQYMDLSDVYELSVGGGRECMITVRDSLLLNDSVVFRRSENDTWNGMVRGMYGVYINGFRQAGPDVMLHDGDFFSLGRCQFYLSRNRLYIGNPQTIVTMRPVYESENRTNHLSYPKFRRSTREQFVLQEEIPEIQPVKPKAKEPKKNLLLTLAPTVISILLMILLRGVMGNGGGFMLYGVAMMAVGAVMSVVNYKNSGKEYLEEQARREEQYRQYLGEKEQEISLLREKERTIRKLKFPTLDENIRFVQDFDKRLFERKKDDEDYLCVYLGQGALESDCQVKYRAPEQIDTEDPLTRLPEQLAQQYKMLADVPVTVDLRETDAVGIIGSCGRLYEMVKQISLDLSIRHFFQDVKLFYLLDEQDMEKFAYLRWLRNTWHDSTGRRNFFYDEESRKSGLERLFNELSYRESCGAEAAQKMPNLVVFVYRSADFLTHPVSRYVQSAHEYGVVFLFFEEYPELLTLGCDRLIYLSEQDNSGRLVESADAEKTSVFQYGYLSEELAAWTARRLGCIYIEEVNLEGGLTSNISLFSMLGILHAKDLDLKTRWQMSRVFETMAAPLGLKSGNEIVYLDLHEKFHGPHGLVAGTTGSGKSEILQSYILSMATLFHPYEVSFLIIDFKGGGMVNQFRELPHLIGAITNIDGREIDRSLMSIRAELQKRQALFAELEVNHIDAYIKKYRAGEARIALPHLILIVDEFAELKSDQPEFMKELISTARIGRSLGVHLILATQKPSGVVDNQIWSNSKFKLCLKVQNKEDSNEVLKSPLAAEIKEPGRAYLQVGNNEIFQLFQSAYSGAAADSDSVGRQRNYRVCTIDYAGRREVIFEQSSKKKEQTQTQLEAIVEYVHDFCQEQGIERLPSICMQPLPDVIGHERARAVSADEFAICADIGLLDDPARQRQIQMNVCFTQQNTFILGASGYGKTNLVQVIVKELAQKYSPEQVQIYIVDFATMILKSLEGLRHVGGVVTSYEDEKLKNLMKMIQEEMEVRKEKLSRLGLSSYYSYLEGGYQGMPQIVLIVENLTGFRELYPQYDEVFLRICREGISCGISVVVTNAQSSGVSYRYFTNFARRIALYCNNSSEYYSLFDRCRMEPKNTAGRALLEVDRAIYECQTYLAFPGEREVERAQRVREFVAAVNEQYQTRAKRIPEIPPVLTEEYLNAQIMPGERRPYRIPYALDYATTEVAWMDLMTVGVLGMCSTHQLGRKNLVRYILKTLLAHDVAEPALCWIADGMDRAFDGWKTSSIVNSYGMNPQQVAEWVKEIDQILQERYERLMADPDSDFSQDPMLVLLLHNRDSVAALAADKAALECFKRITGKYRPLKVCVLITDLENASISFSAPEPMKMLKDSKNFVVFEDLSELKLCDLPLGKTREYKKPLEQGDAYRILGGTLQKVKTVFCKGGMGDGGNK